MTELKRLSEEEYDRFRRFIYAQTGIAVSTGKVTLLSNRVRRRLRALGLDCFTAYLRLLAAGELPGELERFIDVVTTNETSFFRTPLHFEWFADSFLAGASATAEAGVAGPPLRVWSAACSTGEEPYSLALCSADASTRRGGRPCRVLGTDISETALAVARAGRYEARSLEAVAPPLLRRGFHAAPDGRSWTIRPEVAERCQFRRHNLMEPAGDGPFDCIFVRNVLIYFDRASKAVVLGHLAAALAPGGYLVVGPTEGVHDMLAPFEKQAPFLYRKPRTAAS